MEYKEIIEKLKEFRKEKNVSNEELATLMGKSRIFIFCIENGRTEFKLMDFLKICEILDISPNELLDIKPAKNFITKRKTRQNLYKNKCRKVKSSLHFLFIIIDCLTSMLVRNLRLLFFGFILWLTP